ncbi:hypothetical protein DB354_08535 [Opitutus sp. ER46]|nr:hypothetical protein DB354_08535 [Opitutus sp. ER46]
MIEKQFGLRLEGQPRVIIYAELADTDSYAIGIGADGRISGFRRKLSVEGDHGVERFPVERLKSYDIPTRAAARIEQVFTSALKEVRFSEEVEITTGKPNIYIIGTGRFFGEVRDSYRGSAEPALYLCGLLVTSMANERERDAAVNALLERVSPSK